MRGVYDEKVGPGLHRDTPKKTWHTHTPPAVQAERARIRFPAVMTTSPAAAPRLAVFLALLLRGTSSAPVYGHVVADASSPRGVAYAAGAPPPGGALAWGSFDAAALNATGWAVLDVHTSATELNATLAGYAAGYLEGVLTARDMDFFALNTGGDQPNGKKLAKFLASNWAWMAGMVASSGDDLYWTHVGALMAQVAGLADGQSDAPGNQRKLGFDVVLNGIIQGGDIFNLEQVYGEPRAVGAPRRRDHCSAIIRLTPGNSDILAAHTTWSGLENMYRILKRFDMPLPDAAGSPVPARWTATSSYPGYGLYSSDDFAVLSSGLVTLETTIDNSNVSLAREYASETVVLEWMRNTIANRLATSGPTWAELFSRFASGTYTNSWMLLDTNLFSPGQPPPPETLLVLEEMPGFIRTHDRTPELSRGFWASYNVASDDFIWAISGQQALVDQYGGPTGAGAFFTWANTSRARIFARDAPGVVDEASLRHLMRYNDAARDPLSGLGCGVSPPFSYTNAIADRSDLNEKKGDYVIPDLGYGDSAGIDAKLTSALWMKAAALAKGELPMAVISGPTYDQQPVFAFSNSTITKKLPGIVGMPDVYDFAWMRQPW